ncbi:probable membrane-associated kinase regulator 1 [Zingiber officinale]|uniref:probable membrane-associated kinase regulator 1 n=1 Tax=Zingiber officinale TaxID=94328 RepID=UPI001C4B9257|nr:probable membrane-associated kinase regulator 1 [Zingiber officinale]
METSDAAAAAPVMSSFPSPSSSSSSSDFEFTVSVSPAASKRSCPADELFYKGQLLPLHPSTRICMVRTLLLSSASASSSSTATTASRDSTASSSSSSSAFSAADSLLPDSCNSSSRPSSVAEDDARRFSAPAAKRPAVVAAAAAGGGAKYLSSLANRFSSAFSLHRGGSKKLDPIEASPAAPPPPPPAAKRAKEVIKKYVKKVRPIYEKLSAMQQKNKKKPTTFSFSDRLFPGKKNTPATGADAAAFSQSSFSGNLFGLHPPARKERWAASCPSSMRSSPSHSGLLYAGDAPPAASLQPSSMEELQSAIQSAIAHCKNSLTQPANHNEIRTTGP